MLKEFDELVIWEEEKKGGFNSSDGEISLEVFKKSVVVNTDCIDFAFLQKGNHFAKSKTQNAAVEYLEKNNMECFTLATSSGKLSNLLKPKKRTLKSFVFG